MCLNTCLIVCSRPEVPHTLLRKSLKYTFQKNLCTRLATIALKRFVVPNALPFCKCCSNIYLTMYSTVSYRGGIIFLMTVLLLSPRINYSFSKSRSCTKVVTM